MSIRLSDLPAKRPAWRWLVALVVALLIAPLSVTAQDDWYVEGNAEGLLLTQNEDDGLDGDAEISLIVDWMHFDTERGVHARATTAKSINHDWDINSLVLLGLGLSQDFNTVECDEEEWIFASIQVTEADLSSQAETVIASTTGYIAGVIVAVSTTNPLAGGAASQAAGFAARKVLQWMGSSTDNLGSRPISQVPFGSTDYTLTGPDGGSTIRLSDTSFQSSAVELECFGREGDSTRGTMLSPIDAENGIFPPLLDVLAAVPNLTLEDGGINNEILAGRASIDAAMASAAEFAAVATLYEARFGIDGAAAALPFLAQGRMHQTNEEWEEAVIDFREAFRIAYTALFNGNLGAPFDLPSHMTVIAPTRSVRANSYEEYQALVQGLSATETIDFIDVSGQDSGMEFLTRHGFERTAVILEDTLTPDLTEGFLLGLGRVSGGSIQSPDANCAVEHYEEDSIGAGVFIDGEGPFFEPALDGCGYGEVVLVGSDVENGGIPVGNGPDPNGIFTAQLNLTDELEPGTYNLTFTAEIVDSNGGGTRQISAPFTLIVPVIDVVFSDRFEG